jgi:phosphotransferase family enzyme
MEVGRRVSVVLCDAGGAVLGVLPPFSVEDPWWPEVGPVIAGVRDRFGVDVFVLRMLDVVSETSSGGDVMYLAELVGERPPDLPISPAPALDGTVEPSRAAWAHPGGVAATIVWADEALAALGRPRVGPVEQIKTWNLSSVLRLPTAAGDVWCKRVPTFLTDEGTIITLVAADEPALVPILLASDPSTNTVLMAEVPGQDDWHAPEERLLTMVETLVRLQARWIGRADDLLDAGLPDWRSQQLTHLVEALVSRSEVRVELTPEELDALDELVAELPGRFAALGSCGVPETLVHGDFHPGNWRYDGHSLVLLDWGDVGIGHPMLDMSSFEAYVPDELRLHVREVWIDAWRRAVPGCEPDRAEALLPPIAALRRAVIYRGFLDRIEPTERRYHESDVREWLRAALDAASGTGAMTARS